MSRTYRSVIDRARRILQDTDASNYRYSEVDIVDAVNDSLLEVRKIRPDLFIDGAFTVVDVSELEVDATAIPIEDFYFQSLVYLVSGYMMLRDDEFSLDSRAVNLLNKGNAQLRTVGA